jgi:DNA-binding transcriptional MocR family regulator
MQDAHTPKPRKRTLTDRLSQQFKVQIKSGALRAGDRLPSIRTAAESYGVSKNTVIEAYERLASAGLVTPKHGSGFIVNAAKTPSQSPRPVHVSEAIDIVSLLSVQLEKSYSIRAGDGRPPPSWTEESEIKRYLGPNALRNNEEGYGAAQGLRKLRELIAIGFGERSISVDPDQILMTLGANHALDLIIRYFIAPGDTVLVDDPGYYPLFAKLKLAQVNIVGVKRLANGPCSEDFEQKLQHTNAKLFFTQSYAHNPTGSSIDLPTAHAVLSIAERHGVTIIENDPFKDLMGPADILLSAIDQFKNVIFVGTFSKTLSAAMRTGYIAGRADLITALTDLKMITVVNSSGHIESIVSNVISNGHYRRHIKRLKARIEKATIASMANLARIGLDSFAPPKNGYYLFPVLPSGFDDIALAKAAATKGIFIAPGSLFSIDKDIAPSGIRLNVGHAENPRLYQFLKEECAKQ